MVKVFSRQEIRPLTGIRGFAAILVLLIHFFPLWVGLVPSLHGLSRLAGRGFIGVDLFFILSGFILNYVYFDPTKNRLDVFTYRSFVWHRFIRVWPVHVTTLFLLLGLVFGAKYFHFSPSGDYAWSALPFQLTMTHAWPIAVTDSANNPFAAFSWNYPSWSISAEWFAYLLIFPLTWSLLFHVQKMRQEIIFGLASLIIAIWALFCQPFPLPGCNLVCRVTIEFITGALLYATLAATGKLTVWCQHAATMIFIVVLMALVFAPVSATVWIVVLLFPALLLGLSAERSWIARLFATRPALWLGRISYSIYMTQAIVQRLLKFTLNPAHFQSSPLGLRCALFAVTLILILGTASLFYYLVENPVRTWLRKWADRRVSPPTESPLN